MENSMEKKDIVKLQRLKLKYKELRKDYSDFILRLLMKDIINQDYVECHSRIYDYDDESDDEE
jgi:hypothetical protein